MHGTKNISFARIFGTAYQKLSNVIDQQGSDQDELSNR